MRVSVIGPFLFEFFDLIVYDYRRFVVLMHLRVIREEIRRLMIKSTSRVSSTSDIVLICNVVRAGVVIVETETIKVFEDEGLVGYVLPMVRLIGVVSSIASHVIVLVYRRRVRDSLISIRISLLIIERVLVFKSFHARGAEGSVRKVICNDSICSAPYFYVMFYPEIYCRLCELRINEEGR